MNRKERTLIISTVASLLLMVLNYALAARFESPVLRANAGHSLLDVIVALLVFTSIAFGHRVAQSRIRMIWLANGMTLVVSGFIFYTAYDIFRVVIAPGTRLEARHLWPVTIAALLTIAVAYLTALYREYVGQATHAPSLVASGRHARTVAYTSLLMLLNQLAASLGLTILDPLVALMIMLGVAYTGWKTARPALQVLRQNDASLANSAVLSHLRLYAWLWVGLGVGVLIIVTAWTGLYTLQPGERGVIRRFGRVVTEVGAGLHYRIPLIDRLDWITLDQVRKTETRKNVLLTGNTNLIDLNLLVHYRVTDVAAFLFKVRQIDQLVAWTAESVIRQIVAEQGVDGILTTARGPIQTRAQTETQLLLDGYRAGIRVTNVQLERVGPPSSVAQAFQDVASAREDIKTYVNEARGYHNEVIPKARGEATQMVQIAEAEKQRRIDLATGEADRFLKQLYAYQKAPQVTRIRLYLEALEQVLPIAHKFILDPSLRTHSTDLWFTNEAIADPQPAPQLDAPPGSQMDQPSESHGSRK